MIELCGIHKAYLDGDERVEVLRGADLEVEAGEFVCIVGASGSGKSTLLNLVGGLDRDYRGTVRVAGTDLAGLDDDDLSRIRSGVVSYVFQAFHLLPMPAIENVLVPTWFVRAPVPEDARRRAEALLDRVGLREKAERPPSRLSGGERQRVAIARALVNRPKVLLADEPTGNLDAKTGAEIVELFAELAAEGLAVVMVTHELGLCHRASRVLRLEEGRLVREEGGAS